MISVILILVVNGIFAVGQLQTAQDYLERGRELEASEQYEQALDVWASAVGKLDMPSLAIGREYIRLATARGLRHHYRKASSMYLWGLSVKEVTTGRDVLEEEMAMLRPLAGNQNYKRWQELLEQEDPGLYSELRGFWQLLDPTPGTLYNERLLEHWERITVVRERFQKKSDPPYGTDERGVMYVKYGPPDRQAEGRLRADRSKVIQVCQEIGGCNTDLMPEVVYELDMQPWYEIWVYDRPNKEMQYNFTAIFGEKPGGSFGRVVTIEELIPSSAFTLGSRFNFTLLQAGATVSPSGKVTPGMIIQYLYYEQLAGVDYFFAHRLSRFNNEYFRNEGNIKYQGHFQSLEARGLTLENRNKAPSELSTYEKEFPAIPVEAYHYRLLDEWGRPVAATFLESRPVRAALADMISGANRLQRSERDSAGASRPGYKLLHGVQVSTPQGEILSHNRQQAATFYGPEEDRPVSSVFTIPYSESATQVVLYAELHTSGGGNDLHEDTPFPNSLRGMGRLASSLPEPLESRPGRVEMGDLVLGYRMLEQAPEKVLFPFIVANDREIPAGEELALHIEIYNLEQAPDGIARFEIRYEVTPVRAMEWLRGREDPPASLTLDQEVQGSRFVENLSIRTRELPPGKYRLQIETTDVVSGLQSVREIEFRVVERE